MAHVAGQLHSEAELEMLFHESSLAPAAPSLVKLEHNPSPVQFEQSMTRDRPDRESSNTGTKRRRLTTVKHESWIAAKKEIDAALSIVKSEGGSTDHHLEDKLCFGCKRSSKTGSSARGAGSVVPRLFQLLANCELIEDVVGALRPVDQESEQLPGEGADACCLYYFEEGLQRAID